MKRPRRPVRKAPRKIASKARTRKRTPKLRHIEFKNDPFHLDKSKLPVGWAYQWIVGCCDSSSGWRPVPYSRHAHDFPDSARNASGFISIDGLMLCEIPAEHVKKELSALTDKAKALEKTMGVIDPGKGFYIMPADWVVQGETIPEAQQNEGPPVEVAVTLLMRVSVRWQSAATYLKLTLNEYVRRRILMERPVLGPISPFAPEVVYETVNLSFSPINNFKESNAP